MKFDTHEYWKHDNCTDVFFKPTDFSDNGENIVLSGYWLTQGVHSYWFTIYDMIQITPENYAKWHPYRPQGSVR